MSKRQSSKAAEPERPAPSSSTPTFAFDRFHLLKLHFDELPLQADEKGSEPPSGYDVALEIALFVTVAAPEVRSAEVQMRVKVNADARSKPYALELVAAGYFSVKEGTVEDLRDFCQQLAPAILFPYVRQIVDRTTTDGRFGNVLLDPMNIVAAIDQTKWTSPPTPAAPASR